MFNHAVGDEHLSFRIPIEAPGVGRAVGNNFKGLFDGVIPPDATIHLGSTLRKRTGRADFRSGKDTVEAIEPAVRSPVEIADDIVLGFERPTGQLDDGWPGRFIFTRFNRNENHIRRGEQPNAAVADFDTGEIAAVIEENRTFIEFAFPFGIFEDDDFVFTGAILRPVGIGEILDHPKPTPVVEAHGNRLNNIGLAGEERDIKPLGYLHPLSGFCERSRLRLRWLPKRKSSEKEANQDC